MEGERTTPAVTVSPVAAGAIAGAVAGVLALAVVAPPPGLGAGAGDAPAIRRLIPPPGIAVAAETIAALEGRTRALRRRLASVAGGMPRPDVEVFLKAVEYAVANGEFWKERELEWAREELAECERRIEALSRGEEPWRRARGLVVRGYVSRLDDSAQPYGLVIPENLDLSKPVPLWVWLHGRGDRTADLQFIHRRVTAAGTVSPADAIVLHPFGRYCNGYKSAGEVDVLEAIEAVRGEYPIDADRIVLMGFSMGGAGVWHLGAHHAGMWVAVAPGAGFAETARYNRLKPEDYPPWYEQRLWALHDVPCSVRNLFNTFVVAYSGEKDRQIQAARVMEEAYARNGRTLRHIIGPGMGHRYHPDSLREILALIGGAVRRGRDPSPLTLSLQTQTLRHGRMYWVRLTGLVEHWRDTRVDADWRDQERLVLRTTNVAGLELDAARSPRPLAGAVVDIDGERIDLAAPRDGNVVLARTASGWREGAPGTDPGSSRGAASLRKRPGLQGPIDDVFYEPFLVVTPTGSPAHERVGRWAAFELEHLRDRWRRLFRGDLREKRDVDVTPGDLARYHVILWGDPRSNALIRRVLPGLPLAWSREEIAIGEHRVDAAHHVPVLIYPNPLQPDRYVVIDSGMTFRESHDRTNSLQNPKLPDWALLDISTPPDGERAGRVVAADFFDEGWRVKMR